MDLPGQLPIDHAANPLNIEGLEVGVKSHGRQESHQGFLTAPNRNERTLKARSPGLFFENLRDTGPVGGAHGLKIIVQRHNQKIMSLKADMSAGIGWHGGSAHPDQRSKPYPLEVSARFLQMVKLGLQAGENLVRQSSN